MIVVDVGCKTIGTEESVGKLVARFQPELLYGFDPHPELVEGVSCVGSTLVVTRRLAAWTHDGTIGYTFAGTRSATGPFGAEPVGCFDLAAWLETLPPVGLVVKLDVEGSEYELLAELLDRKLDRRISLLLVEWHGVARVSVACPIEDW